MILLTHAQFIGSIKNESSGYLRLKVGDARVTRNCSHAV